jgi:hypothetical protein
MFWRWGAAACWSGSVGVGLEWQCWCRHVACKWRAGHHVVCTCAHVHVYRQDWPAVGVHMYNSTEGNQMQPTTLQFFSRVLYTRKQHMVESKYAATASNCQ